MGGVIESAGASLAVIEPRDAVASYFAEVTREQLDGLVGLWEHDVEVVPEAWRDVAAALPPLSRVLSELPRSHQVPLGDITWFQPADATWAQVASMDAPGAYRVRRFATLDLVRDADDISDGTVARCTVQLGKHLAALIAGRPPLIAYDPDARHLSVPLGADLPGLYGRALVAASGMAPEPVPGRRVLRYSGVPPSSPDTFTSC